MAVVRPAEPLISCLTVTQDPRRLPYLVRSIDCFRRQTWRRRELVVLQIGDPAYGEAIARHLHALGDDRVRHAFVGEPVSLGEARNRSVEAARGEVVCLWDDDDMSHPRRLELQHGRMRRDRAEASFLPDHLHFFEDTRELYWVDWRPDLHPGTLLAARRCLEAHPYPPLPINEDAPVREALRSSCRLSAPSGYGYLYLYCYTGLNVYARAHHESIPRVHDPTFVRGRVARLRASLADYGLDPREVVLRETVGPWREALYRLRRWTHRLVPEHPSGRR